ncbi:MAG: hypothetical protein JJU00_18025 [Opitutales bacterium]|nr:hypothetical protein [Opitutales bacterium]
MKTISVLIASVLVSSAAVCAAPRHAGAGNHHSVFLNPETHDVWTVGEDILGQMGYGMESELIKDNPHPHRVDPVWGGKAVDVSAGLNTNAVVTDLGEVWTWGFNRLNQLGHSAGTEIVPEPRRVEGLPPVADIEAGSAFMLAITTEGQLYAWGNNALDQLGLGPDAPRRVAEPTHVELPDDVRLKDITTGINQVVALTADNRVLAWGSNRNRQAGGPADENTVSRPAYVEGLPDGVAVAAVGVGNYTSFAILEDGRIFAWGENQFGQIPGVDERSVFPPVEVELPEGADRAVAITGGARYVHALVEDGRVYAWGVNGPQGQFGDGTRTRAVDEFSPPRALPDDVRLRELHTQTNHTVALTRDGRFVGWGSNAQGRLAQDDRMDSGALVTVYPEPVDVRLVMRVETE